MTPRRSRFGSPNPRGSMGVVTKEVLAGRRYALRGCDRLKQGKDVTGANLLSNIQPAFSAKIILSDGQTHSLAYWLPVTSITSVTCSRRHNAGREDLGSSTTRRAALKVILVQSGPFSSGQFSATPRSLCRTFLLTRSSRS